ncbi:hypothetical protein DMB66_57465 [Actinoplanes sp. ATCC 53533]|uniref:peptidase inhibitor family I36 protein n=1 Tax=Actinoplanes sp. ATCC 53533 TaxID=1288362 RepID=UPI000F7ADA76|nr:peptidase inhibitor family I36 protein [Actinoplanes sp. ATCC 53533]RSM40148.1 hypothetical protein DMB66_57465 [Actinoplanes sp. ATCC 53533]
MSRNRRLLAVLVSLAAAVSVPLTISSPAMAYGSRPASCNTASLCFYANNNFVDGPGKVTSAAALGSYSHSSCAGGTWNNCMSSVWNATTKCFHLHADAGPTGGFHNLGPNDGYTNLGSQAAYDNTVSYVKSGRANCSF